MRQSYKQVGKKKVARLKFGSFKAASSTYVQELKRSSALEALWAPLLAPWSLQLF